MSLPQQGTENFALPTSAAEAHREEHQWSNLGKIAAVKTAIASIVVSRANAVVADIGNRTRCATPAFGCSSMPAVQTIIMVQGQQWLSKSPYFPQQYIGSDA